MDKDNLLSHVTPKEIFEYYTGYSIRENVARYKNPLRSDSKGTCYFKQYSKSYLLVDPADRDYTVDCFGLVMRLYNLDFKEALAKIDFDMNISSKTPIVRDLETVSIRSTTEFDVKLRAWEFKDLQYWMDYNVNLETLNNLNIYPVKSYKVKTKSSTVFKNRYKDSNDDPCYVMVFKKKKIRCKFYRPLNPEHKWESNIMSTDIMGEGLVKKSDTLYILSGFKDCAVAHQLGLDVRAPQSESEVKSIVKHVSNLNYKTVVILYDNDPTGIKYSERVKEELEKENSTLTVINKTPKLKEYESKDLADVSRDFGLHIVNELLCRN